MLVDALNLPGVNPEQGETYLQARLVWLRSESNKNLWNSTRLIVVKSFSEAKRCEESHRR